MAHKFKQGIYYPKNAKKYIGNTYPQYRSSWELRIFKYLDENKNVISWASEPIKIPYMNAFKGKIANYIPDLLIKFIDRNGNEVIELVEIKPASQTFVESAKSDYDKRSLTINHAKWQAATAWCKQQGIRFRILTENQIFGPVR